MFANYIKIALRVLTRQKTYALINIIGLTVGIASFVMIMLYIRYEHGFDQHIPGIGNLYRCVEIQHPQGVSDQHVAVTMSPLGTALMNDFPEITDQVRLMNWGKNSVLYEGRQFNQEGVVFADPSVFRLFNVRLLSGDTGTVLTEPKSMVISKKAAEKIFGSAESAMGKIVLFNGEDGYKIGGVMEDQPKQAHFQMELLISFITADRKYEWLKGWGNNSMATYVRVYPGTDVNNLEAKFPEFIKKHSDFEDESWVWELYLQPLKDIHLKSGHIKFQVANDNQGDIRMIWVFSIIGILIILIASINFINLAIARSVKRAKEVGMRKVLGANHWNLMYQFLGESFIITLISIILSLILIEFMLPAYNRMLGTDFRIDILGNPVFNIGLIIILVFVSLVSGSYPAFYLSRFRPMKVLQSSGTKDAGRTGFLSKGLVGLQFVFTIGMLFSIGVVYMQFHYVMNKDLGLNYDQVISIELYNHNSAEEVQRIKNLFSSEPGVKDMAQVADINGVSGSQGSITADDPAQTKITVRYGFVDYNYFPMMDIPIVKGRNFSREFATDHNEALILNQAAIDFLDWDDPIGQTFQPFMDTLKRKVIGIISDYHYYSLRSKIEPAVYLLYPGQSYRLALKLGEHNIQETISNLEVKWSELFPGVPFEYGFAENYISDLYRGERNTLVLFSYFTILSILISCLGLYGLTALSTERRTKEIGIRKVFGSSIGNIVVQLIRGYILLVIISGLIALPLSWYFISKALEKFAYSITITWIYFVLPVIIVGLFAVFTTIYHAVKAATLNPVKSIRYE
ncbi:MAG: FtsX-like permease family protein [Bacteroidetes bacterium]|nr:FtsX-like permease family protein [Bacteroidota bacterium]